MSGVAPDPLDRIAAELSPGTGAGPDVTIDRAVALALVEVARAARDMQVRRVPMTPALGRALMRLARLEGAV